MTKNQKPFERIQELYEARKTWSDAAVLAELYAFPVLPDEDDSAWGNDATWQEGYRFVALADTAALRRLQAAIPLLLERAAYGDPGSMMRDLRHSLEAIVNPEWDVLTDMCIHAAQSPHRGARLWAIEELARLEDYRALPALLATLHDTAALVREKTCSALERVCKANPQARIQARDALNDFIAKAANEEEAEMGRNTRDAIEQMQK